MRMLGFIRREWRDLAAYILLSFALTRLPIDYGDGSLLHGLATFAAFMLGLSLFVRQRIREERRP